MLVSCLVIFPAHFSSALLVFMASWVMMLIGRVRFRELMKLVVWALVVVLLSMLFSWGRGATAEGRFSTWANLWTHTQTEKPIEELTDTERSMIAIHNGGILGEGAGQSAMRVEMIHPESDYAYAFFVEEYGLLLAVAVVFIYRQMRRLSAARNNLEQTNEQLQLSNNIKEEYVGRFMNLCSIYINRLDTYRRMVNKKISAGQMDELLKMVRSREVLDTGLKELYENFDIAFLHLFPDFVDKFNDLLQPEERIVLRKGELLNTELRIFALIRLGIDDSSQIAEFLRYSVNTIYNYRAKVKNKARISREDFEMRLMQIR